MNEAAPYCIDERGAVWALNTDGSKKVEIGILIVHGSCYLTNLILLSWVMRHESAGKISRDL